MTGLPLAAEEYLEKSVYDPTGTFLGTVADVDAEAGLLFVDPDPDPTEESWAEVGDGTFVNYGNDWLGVPDYEVWNEGEAADAGFDEWPYTVEADEIDEVTDDAVRLTGPSLTDAIAGVLSDSG